MVCLVTTVDMLELKILLEETLKELIIGLGARRYCLRQKGYLGPRKGL